MKIVKIRINFLSGLAIIGIIVIGGSLVGVHDNLLALIAGGGMTVLKELIDSDSDKKKD